VTNFDALVAISGTLGYEEDGVIAKTFEAQVRRAFINLKKSLTAAGLEIGDVIHWRHYLVDGNDFAVVNRERLAALGDALPPAAMSLYVPRMIRPEALYEVEALAARVRK
jgi:enamine deaminase RidA (YjgF/YER057c/UK114 family)